MAPFRRERGIVTALNDILKGKYNQPVEPPARARQGPCGGGPFCDHPSGPQ
jgi:hypothetical protein